LCRYRSEHSFHLAFVLEEERTLRKKDVKMKSAYITRAFALANLLFVSVGVWIFASMSGGWRRGFLPPVSSAPFARYIYVVDAIVTAAIFAALVYSAARLLRGGTLAARTVRRVYICELLYLFVRLCVEPVVLVLLPQSWRWSITAGHAGIVSLWPQVLTAYPAIGAIVMTLLIRRVQRQPDRRVEL
jgi:hypothetical protein